MKKSLLLFILAIWASFAYAQEFQLTGKVVNEAGQSIPGVNVYKKGITEGVVTDVDGDYALKVSPESVVVFSFVGYAKQEIQVGNQTVINVTLQPEAIMVEQAVVTALGIKRESKALGYAVQEVQGDDLVQARETNFINSLSGRIAGVNITNGPGSIGGSSRIVIRGETSLTGNNQPLFVVDGVPITNSIIGSEQSGQDIDYGNGAASINPADVSTVTILKGANAAALYGSRAANGVILITTKSGQQTQGIGLSVTSGLTLETPLRLPDYQNEYGQGRGGVYNIGDGGRSWGPRLDGRTMQIPVNTEWPPSDGEEVIWEPYPDNVKEFYKTGETYFNNIAFSGNNEKGHFRFSYTNLEQTGIVPNTDQTKNTFSLNSGYNPSDKITIEIKANYINTMSDNRPVVSYGNESPVYTWIWEGRQVRTEKMKDYWVQGQEGTQPFTYNYRFNDNPYYTAYENLNGLQRNRVIGVASVTYNIIEGLQLMLRAGTDFLNERRTNQRTHGSNAFRNGMFRLDKNRFQETNLDFLATYSKTFINDWSISVSAGGNQMQQIRQNLSTRANELNIPGIYNLGNSRVPLENIQFDSEYRINSLYGLAQIAYKNALFLDATARNDWSSTLPAKNNSYFYPSVSASAVISEFLDLDQSSALSFAKIRFGWAQVGSDTDPYKLRNVFLYGTPWEGNPTLYDQSSIANSNLKPEISSTFEIGTDVQFIQNRIALDVTYYNSISKNQILSVPIDITTGYTSMFLNAGKIQNKGFEVMLGLTPLRSTNGLNWDINFNWSKNYSEVLELAEGITTYELPGRVVSLQARVGEQMGDIYGDAFERDPNGNIVHENGLPLRASELKKLGNYNPDWLAGMYNTFSYRGLVFGILFDMQQGGSIYSRMYQRGNEAGQLEETLPGREDGIVGNGVMLNEAGQYVPNDVNVTAERYYGSGAFNDEASTFDASFVKLREVKIGYTFSNSLLKNTPIKNINLSFVGRNLFLWTDVPHIDPETSALNGGTFLPGIEDLSLPSTRSFGFNLSFNL